MQKRFNQYHLAEQISSKPFRSAYLAHHVNDVSQKVLLKVFDATCLALGQESEQLLDQVKWIKQLRHAHIVPILDLGVEQGQPYVVSEYLSGGSLRRRLDSLSSGRLSLQETMKIILQVGQALSYFHGNAHLHQNVKPENIFFNNWDEVLLTDFHLSGFINVAQLGHKSDPCNMCYMAPEQFAGSASEKSDQYALACLAYELIAGHVPFSVQSFAIMWASHYAEVPAPLSDLVPDLPKWVGEAIFKAMAKDPSERYADIAEFLFALEGTGESTPVALSPFDPFSVSEAKSFDNIKSDLPVTSSVTGISSEESLATAPFGTSLLSLPLGASLLSLPLGTSLPGVPLGASLPGVPLGASLPGVPLGTSLPGVPLGTSLPGVPLRTSLLSLPLRTSLPGVPLGTSLLSLPLGTSLPGVPLGTSLPGNPFEQSQQEDFLAKALGENPFEVDQPTTLLLACQIEHWGYTSKEPYSKANPDLSTGSNHRDPFSRGHLWHNARYSIVALWLGQTRKPSVITSWLIQIRDYLRSLPDTVRIGFRRGLTPLSQQLARLLELRKRVSIDRRAKKVINAHRLAGDAPIKPFSVGYIFQHRRDSIPVVLFGQRRDLPAPVVWLVIFLSIAFLIASIAPCIFLALQSLGQPKSLNTSNNHQIMISIKKLPTDDRLSTQPAIHTTGTPIPQQDSSSSLSGSNSQTSMSWSNAKQCQTYNLSNQDCSNLTSLIHSKQDIPSIPKA